MAKESAAAAPATDEATFFVEIIAQLGVGNIVSRDQKGRARNLMYRLTSYPSTLQDWQRVADKCGIVSKGAA